jgi:hypothetical protein
MDKISDYIIYMLGLLAFLPELEEVGLLCHR